MSAFDTIASKLAQLPRAFRWAIAAIVGIALFMIWSEAIQPISDGWNQQSAVIQSNVQEARSAETIVRRLRSADMERFVTAIGPVRIPMRVADGTTFFNEVVLDVLARNGATNSTLSARSRGKLAKSALVEVTGGIDRVDRFTGDVKFDATPRSAAAIIAELETSPYIESVNSVRLTRDTGGKVKVSLTVEAWLLTSEQGET